MPLIVALMLLVKPVTDYLGVRPSAEGLLFSGVLFSVLGGLFAWRFTLATHRAYMEHLDG